MNKTQIETLLKKDWYVQGINAVPAYIAAGPVSGIFACKKTLGYNYFSFIMDFKNDYCELYYSKNELNYMCNEFMKRYKKNKNYIRWLYKTSEREKKPVINYIKNKLDKISKLTDKKLIEEYKKFANAFYYCFGASHLIEAISLTTDVIIRDMLLRHLKKVSCADKFTKYFTELTQPTKKFFFSEFNKNMLNLVNLIKRRKEFNHLLDKDICVIEKELDNFKELDKLISKHIKKFFWIKSQWNIGKEYSKLEVIKEIKELLEKKEKIGVITDKQLKENLKKKKELFKKLNMSRELIDLIEITDFVMYWQDDRKIVMLSGCWALEKFVNEICRRFDFNKKNLKYLLPDEMSYELMKHIKNNDLKERRIGSLFIYHKNQRCILTGKDYNNIKQKLADQKKCKDTKELNGMCASIGKVIGKVKVCLNEAEIPKVEDGDVLVTTMTRPEFFPAMKKATAIVTDEGGITCHAAIVSRELKIPCVVGTGRATKLFKDGDLVEVNANHASIRLIERKKINKPKRI